MVWFILPGKNEFRPRKRKTYCGSISDASRHPEKRIKGLVFRKRFLAYCLLFRTVSFRTVTCGHDYSPMNLSKTSEIQLRDKTQQNVRDQQRIENQETELKKLNEKTSKVIREINQLEKVLKAEKLAGQVCTICFEEYKEDRRQVAFGPCGHHSCYECSPSLQLCPLCRAEIEFTLLIFHN